MVSDILVYLSISLDSRLNIRETTSLWMACVSNLISTQFHTILMHHLTKLALHVFSLEPAGPKPFRPQGVLRTSNLALTPS